MPKCDGYESRKKWIDDAWLNPKHYLIGNQQPSSEKEKVQRLSLDGSRNASDWHSEVVGIRKDEDIVCALWKHKDVFIYRQSIASFLL